MRQGKWWIVCGLAALLAGCQQPPAEEPTSSATTPEAGVTSPIKIGFLVKQPEEPWFQNEWKFAQEAADTLGFELIKIGTTDGEKVLAAIDNLHAQGAQGFVICTPDVKLGPAIAAKAKANEMKVFSVDDRFVNADGSFMDTPYMGISASEIGKMVGEALYAEMIKREWPMDETAAMGITLEELDTAKARTDGASEALVAAGFPTEQIHIGALTGKAEVSNALDAANIVLTQNPDSKHWLVFGMNDESVLGGVRALEGRGFKADETIGIGIGGSTGMVDWEKSEPTGFFAAVLISPKRHGYETAEMMYHWIKDGTEPPAATFTSGIMIHRDDYQQIMKDQGLLDDAS